MRPNVSRRATRKANAVGPFCRVLIAKILILTASFSSFACDGESDGEPSGQEVVANENADDITVEPTTKKVTKRSRTGRPGPEGFSHEVYVENLDEAESCEARRIAFDVWMDDLPRSCSKSSDCITAPTLGCPTPISASTPNQDLIVTKRDAVWRICEKQTDTVSCDKGVDCIGGRCRSTR
jgi:hypothetical protein